MNRFRNKKKVKEDLSASIRTSTEEQHSFMGFRRTKKAPEEEKKEIDIANVLPPSDDFRTSLLMTGLSARFSMLREQDDPSTKIGKALDDSVLFPKRQSKLMDYGFRGLDDIAEVESIRAMPPFMRTNSYASDTDSVQDSIMNRTRPTDGNNLFGGRQKIYRIPTSATSSKALDGEGGMSGRALYENDVALSAFQKLRQERKERLLSVDDDADGSSGATITHAGSLLSADAYDPMSGTRSESPSPVDFNLRRETSSTASSAARDSTAATSVASQPAMSYAKDWQASPQAPSSMASANGGAGAATSSIVGGGPPPVERMTTQRIRRLYEQGLNQDMHEHQSSALSRIDTLTGKRMLRSRTPEPASAPSPTTGAGLGLGDRFVSSASTSTVASTLERLERRQALAKTSSTNLRSLSPPMSGSSTGSPAMPSSELMPTTASASLKGTAVAPAEPGPALPHSPPLSPPVSDAGGDHLAMAIQPGDVGKATSLGMFQKPALPYDESRFAQRQLQLKQGRETPTERFRSGSEASRTPFSPPPVAAVTATAGLNNDEPSRTRKTFLFDDDEADDEPQQSRPPPQQLDAARPQVVLQRPSDADHPAFRQTALPTALLLPNLDASPAPAPVMPKEPEPPVTKAVEVLAVQEESKEPVDSPTLGPGGGLNGMVFQHLRSTSTASSVYSNISPPYNSFDTPPLPVTTFDTSISMGDFGLKIGRPWDDNNWTASVYSSISDNTDKRAAAAMTTTVPAERAPETELPPLPPHAPASTPAPTPAPAPAPPTPRVAAQRPPIPETPRSIVAGDVDNSRRAPSLRSMSSRSRMTSVADSNRSSNNLDGDDDDDDFASQLANARRRVQERLTTYAESDSSRNTSPLLAPTELPSLPTSKVKPLGMLRAKSSRGSILERSRDAAPAPVPAPLPAPAKAMKMLGLGLATMSTAPSPSKQSFDEAAVSLSPASPGLTAPSAVSDGFALDTASRDKRDKRPPLNRDDSYFSRVSTSSPTATSATTATTATTTATDPSPAPRSSTETDTDTEAEGETEADADNVSTASNSHAHDAHDAHDDDNNIHPGLRAFRNARRQLQKRKELETLARHHDDAPGQGGAEPRSATSSAAAAFAEQQSPPRRERRGTLSSTPGTRERKPPPVFYQPRREHDAGEESQSSSSGNRSRSGSRASGQTERDRSGSDTSNSGTYTRHAPPPRLRTNGGPHHDEFPPYTQGPPPPPPSQQQPQQSQQPSQASNGHLGPPSRPGVPLRSPGLPGTDIRRSPHMPPQAYPGSSPASNKLSVQTAAMGSGSAGRSPSSGYAASPNQHSPISPLGSAGLPISPFALGSANGGSGPPTPTNGGNGGGRMPPRSGLPIPPHPPQQMQSSSFPSLAGAPYSTTTSSLTDVKKKAVRKMDISEPTFLMSTSRVPTMSLPQSASAPEIADGGANGQGSRSRSSSRARAGSNAASAGFVPPPLPPINPMRKQSASGGPGAGPGAAAGSNGSSSRGPRGMFNGFMGRRIGGGGGDNGGDEMDTMSALTMPTLPLSPSASSSNLSVNNNYKFGGAASDNDDNRFEQRTLRKQASEASGMHARMTAGGGQRMDLPGGMI